MKKNAKEWDKIERKIVVYWKKQLNQSEILQDLPENVVRDWNNASFRTVDSFLNRHCNEIMCADVSAIYWKFLWDIKKN